MNLEYYKDLVGGEYILALVIFAGFFLISKLAVFIIERFLMNLAKKTETKTDDLILEAINKPLSIVLLLIGIIIGVQVLSLKANTAIIINSVIDTLIIIIITYVAMKVIKIIIFNWGEHLAKKTKSKVDDQVVKLADNFFTAVIWIIGAILILESWDVEIGPFLASIGIAGLAIAFALQTTLSNIFGGVSMIIDKTIRVGDVVEIDKESTGEVLDVGIRSTKIRSWNNEVIIIPNGTLADSRIVNYVQPTHKVRVEVPFGVAYGSDIEKVKKIVLKELPTVGNYIPEPEPHIKFLAMADSSLNFKAYFYVNSYENRFAALDEANTKIYNALNKAKIEIPFPQMDVHMKK